MKEPTSPSTWRLRAPAPIPPDQRLQRVLDAFGSHELEQADSAQWYAKCPCHADDRHSLGIGHEGDKVLVNCLAGCATSAVLAAVGLAMRDLFDVAGGEVRSPRSHPKSSARPRPRRPLGRLVDRYFYVDEQGEPLFKVHRHEPKTFRQFRWTGTEYVPKLGKPGEVRRVLYRLPKVIAAVAAGEPIYFCEGEKDVHALESVGEVATTLQQGAGVGWEPARQHVQHTLRGATVVVVADRDEPGLAHAERVRAALSSVAGSVQVVLPKPTHPKADAYDHIAAGYTVAEFLPVAREALEAVQEQTEETNEAEAKGLKFQSLSEIAAERTPVSWLVRGWWLDGATGVVGGAEKALKTWFLVLMGVAVASGTDFLNEEDFAVPERRRVLYLTGEGGAELIYDRVAKACEFYGVPVEDIEDWFIISDTIMSTEAEGFAESVQGVIGQHDVGLVIVDPAYVYLAPGDGAGNVFSMGGLLAGLARTCKGAALMLAHHFKKGVGDEPELSDLTQAGFREWAGTWVLLWHRVAPDLEMNQFMLGVKRGSRRGFGDRHGLDVYLGPYDQDTLDHRGRLTCTVLPMGTARESKEDALVGRILAYVTANPGVNGSQIDKECGLGTRDGPDLRALLAKDGRMTTSKGPKNSTLYSVP